MEIPSKRAEKFLQTLFRGVWKQAVQVEARTTMSFQSHDGRTDQNIETNQQTVEEGGDPHS